MLSIAISFSIVFLLIIANGVFAMSEIAVISARKTRLQQQESEGDTRAGAALRLADSPNLFLSTVQIGITLVGILSGAFGGATITDEMASLLSHLPIIAPYSRSIGFGLVVVGITYLTLVIGELVPKRIGLIMPERIASYIAGPMQYLSLAALPAVRLLSLSTEGVLWLMRIREVEEPPVSEEEIRILIDQGTQAGLFEKEERDMVESVFRLDQRKAGSLMRSRAETVWLDVEDSPDVIRQKITKSRHSRFPVCAGGIENVLGIVQAKDLLTRCLAGKPINLKASMRYPLYVFENASALQLLKLFRKAHRSIALVVDEYGSIQGMVTINDVLESIVGDIPTIHREGEPEVIHREDGSWLVDGSLSMEEFKDIFNIKQLPGENRGYFHTLGGFIMMHLGHIPKEGEHFEWEGLRFEIMDMDGHRVDKLLIVPLQLDR